MYSTKTIIRTISFAGALVFVTLSPTARAVDPPPDGGYDNFNTAEGTDALFSLTSGFSNTAIGFNALYSNTIGANNTANGVLALSSNTSGSLNTAIGADALSSNTTGVNNTATGVDALLDNTIGINNTANGFQALLSNTCGDDNTASGLGALFSNTTGGNNTANGVNVLSSNTTGASNTASGVQALFNNIDGDFNTANGVQALLDNENGINNTADGVLALSSNTSGSFNTAIGSFALNRNRIGDSNIALGSLAGQNLTTGDNNIDIGNAGVAGESGKIRIGTAGTHKRTAIAGISGVTVPGGVGVIVDFNGHLGTVTSSERFKYAIKPMDKASEAVLALKPVSFRYKHELDPDGILQFGLVAEQVERVNPDLVARDDNGKAYTVRYEAVNAMLLNEFLKQHRKVQELEATVAKLQSVVQKVSNQIELIKPGPRVVTNQ
jgi:trimeric autotransporter adhesin